MNSAMRRSLLKLGFATLLAPAAGSVMAQAADRNIAVPFYNPGDVLAGLYQYWAPPRAAAFSQAAGKLQQALTSFCQAPAANPPSIRDVRHAWQAAVTAWEQLSAVPFGPLIERRSVRAIDFEPTRPPLIERAIGQAPRGAAAMERVGTPAKGFPALEWLLWEKPVVAGTQACAYAVEVAADVAREADALRLAFETAKPVEWDGEQTAKAYTEFVNQWVGSVERLRWQKIERPVREAKSRSRSAARFPRHAAAATAQSWATHWSALRELAVAAGDVVPQPGQAIIPIESYLLGRGRMDLARRWRQGFAEASVVMQGLAPAAQDRLLPAARRLAAIKRMAEEDVAPALDVSIGFSDADGD